MTKLITVLKYLLDDSYSGFHSSANVTRIDFTIDLPNIEINKFLMRCPGFPSSKLFYDPFDRLSTSQIGKARKIIKFYDKKAEIEIRVQLTGNEPDVARLEIMIKPNICISELKQIPNPFKSIEFYTSNINPEDFDPEFMHVLQKDGLQRAFTDLRDRKLRKLQKNIKQYRTKLFDPEEVWAGLDDALEFLKKFRN